MRALVVRMDQDLVWDHIQARDLDQDLIDFVANKIHAGFNASEICKELGLKGGKTSRQWRKIQAHFRHGFRADADVYLESQTRKVVQVIEKTRLAIEDALENGTPMLNPKTGDVTYVKGATKDLAAMLAAYDKIVGTPVKLWKDYGVIGEKKESSGSGVTIVVQNNIPMPSQSEIVAHQKEMQAKLEAIEVKVVSPGKQ